MPIAAGHFGKCQGHHKFAGDEWAHLTPLGRCVKFRLSRCGNRRSQQHATCGSSVINMKCHCSLHRNQRHSERLINANHTTCLEVGFATHATSFFGVHHNRPSIDARTPQMICSAPNANSINSLRMGAHSLDSRGQLDPFSLCLLKDVDRRARL